MSTPASYVNRHLEELRQRLLTSFLAIIVCSAGAYYFAEDLARLCMAPLFASQPTLVKLIYTNLTEAFITYIKLAILVGIIVSFPILLYQAWMFVAPGLKSHEKKLAARVVFWATLLFASGVGFAFFIVLPKVLSFFMGFAGAQLEPLPRLGGYLTFVARTCLAFGLSFEIPFLMVIAAKTGLVGKGYFRAKRKFYYPAILVLALLLTAGDLMAAVLLAIPLFGLYEAGIFTIRLFGSADK